MTTALMEQVLDNEKPDMIIIGGDCIAGYNIDNDSSTSDPPGALMICTNCH